MSSELQQNAEANNGHKFWESRSKRCFIQENSRQASRQSSVESYNSEQNRDMVTGAKPTPHTVPQFLTGRPMQSRERPQRQIQTMTNLRTQPLGSLRLHHQLLLLTPLADWQKY